MLKYAKNLGSTALNLVPENLRPLAKAVFWLLLFLWGTNLVFPFIVTAFNGYWENLTPGTFGDMFGAVNALFSGLALFGVAVAIFIQGQELKAQLDTFKLDNQEFQNQNRLSKLQIANTLVREHLQTMPKWQVDVVRSQKSQDFRTIGFRPHVDLYNHGRPVHNVTMKICSDNGKFQLRSFATFALGGPETDGSTPLSVHPTKIEVHYLTDLGKEFMETFIIRVDGRYVSDMADIIAMVRAEVEKDLNLQLTPTAPAATTETTTPPPQSP